MRVLFHKFSKHYDLWDRAVKCSATVGNWRFLHNITISNTVNNFFHNFLSVLLSLLFTFPDVLLSLALYSASYDTCRPDIVTSEEAYLHIEDGSHPTLLPSFSPGDFIPNNTHLGKGEV